MRSGSLSGSILSTGISPCCCPEILVSTAEPKKLSELLKEEHDLDTELIPGLSSIAYLAAKIGISWENAEIVSLHGQEENFIQTVSRNRKTFFLLGGRDTGRRFLERFREFGMRDVEICIWEEPLLSG